MSDYSNAIRMGIFTVAIYVAAQTTGLRYLYYLAYVLAAVLFAAFVWARLSKRDLRMSRSVRPSQAQVGGIVEETIELENLSWVRKLWLEVRDRSTLPGHHVGAVVSLKGHGGKRWRVKTRCTRRGLYRLGPTAIVTGDPFGLVQTGRVFDESAELLVYPAIVPLQSFGLRFGELPGGGRTERRSFHSTPNAAGIRLYQPGDPMNRIHWPMSARTQQLMVKEFELDPTADLWLILDLNESVHVAAPDDLLPQDNMVRQRTGWMPRMARQAGMEGVAEPETTGLLALEPSTEEYSVTVTASLAAYFLGQGKSVGLIAWGQHRVTIPADRGGRQLIKILRALAVLRAEGEVALEEVLVAEQQHFSRQDTLVIVTPSLDEAWVASLQLQLYRIASAAAVLVEPGTFGGVGNPLLTVSALSALNVPSYLVKRDDSIDAALHQQFAGPAVRNLR
ncbi:MAG TPA: DUF58 domain-containing protein [Chloroflexia bacterium]|nr:DUF58 domain-containing protein [Chloroflexia bacterium]